MRNKFRVCQFLIKLILSDKNLLYYSHGIRKLTECTITVTENLVKID